MKKVHLTKEGFEKLKKEYEELKKRKRPLALDRLQKARGMGDLTESSEYTAAKENLELIDERINEIEEILRKAEIITKSNNNQVIGLGSTVLVEVDGKKEQYHIVGEFEADPTKKKISHNSPIGKALIGKKVNEWVEVQVPTGKIKYKVVDIK